MKEIIPDPFSRLSLYITSVDMVKEYYCHDITHLVSIGDVGVVWPMFKNFPTQPRLLRLEFKDTTDVTKPTCPKANDIGSIIKFAAAIKFYMEVKPVNLLIHCQAGISRSTAAAFIILNTIAGPGYETVCLNKVYHARCQMLPNELMVSLADDILVRNGAMLTTIRRYNKNAFSLE